MTVLFDESDGVVIEDRQDLPRCPDDERRRARMSVRVHARIDRDIEDTAFEDFL
jgi:hypothetical protein